MLRFLFALAVVLAPAISFAENPIMSAVQRRSAAFHAGEKPSGSVVRLV